MLLWCKRQYKFIRFDCSTCSLAATLGLTFAEILMASATCSGLHRGYAIASTACSGRTQSSVSTTWPGV